MKQFSYHEPKTVSEACSLLSQFGHEARVLAGGTDLIVKMKQGVSAPKHLVNLKKIDDLGFIRGNEEGYHIGALARISDIAEHEGLQGRVPMLCSAARSLGSAQVRNIATLGGNLCNASPAADMAPGLLALDAVVNIVGPTGDRVMPLEAFYQGPGEIALGGGEILTRVFVPYPPEGTRQIYIKHGPRRAMDIAIVGVAVALLFDSPTDPCKMARIALGAVAPTPVRAKKTEKIIEGRKMQTMPLKFVSETLRQEIAPLSDVRASKRYRTEMVGVLTLRAIDYLTRSE
jgi:CO/xanthine dehydrogenase FAD-binding subunit